MPASSSSTPPRAGSRSPRSTCGSSSCVGVRHGRHRADQGRPRRRRVARARPGRRRDHVAGTFLAGAPVVDVDAPAGIGLDELRAALDRLPPAPPRRPAPDRPRLWIDRAFVARGAGTVVTGTLTGGSLRTRRPADRRPRRPAGAGARPGVAQAPARRGRRREPAGGQHHRRRPSRTCGGATPWSAGASGGRRRRSTPRSRCSHRWATR